MLLSAYQSQMQIAAAAAVGQPSCWCYLLNVNRRIPLYFFVQLTFSNVLKLLICKFHSSHIRCNKMAHVLNLFLGSRHMSFICHWNHLSSCIVNNVNLFFIYIFFRSIYSRSSIYIYIYRPVLCMMVMTNTQAVCMPRTSIYVGNSQYLARTRGPERGNSPLLTLSGH